MSSTITGDRAALTASALAAGYAERYGLDPAEACLPQKFALAGHSLGGALVSGVSKSGSPAPRMITGRPSRFRACARAPIFRISETPMVEIREAGEKPAPTGSSHFRIFVMGAAFGAAFLLAALVLFRLMSPGFFQ